MNDFDFEFDTQICTTRYQSDVILNLGLRSETADAWHCLLRSGWCIIPSEDLHRYTFEADPIPAWGLHRLIEIFNRNTYESSEYLALRPNASFFDVIEAIAWMIQQGYMPKELMQDDFNEEN